MIPRRLLLPIALGVALLQIGVLVFMIASRAEILRTGTEVTLQVEPVDPRDLLRGDYVVLGYNISRIPAAILTETPQGDGAVSEQTIFVRLKADGDGIWQPVAARYDAPLAALAADGEVDIRGTTHRLWSSQTEFIDVLYGIERFYVPEGEGRDIERNLTTRAFTMKVSVNANGAAQIKSFYDGATLLYAEPIY
jgi:uncharacterized membrane-anchored protein